MDFIPDNYAKNVASESHTFRDKEVWKLKCENHSTIEGAIVSSPTVFLIMARSTSTQGGSP